MLQSDLNIFYLTWIMSLHYLVKLEMLIGQVLLLGCYRKKIQNLFHLNCVATKFARFESSWLQRVASIRCTKYASLIWTNWNSHWERSGPSWIMSSLRQPFVSGVVDSSRSVICVLYTFSWNISHMLLLTAFKSAKLEDIRQIWEFLSVTTQW